MDVGPGPGGRRVGAVLADLRKRADAAHVIAVAAPADAAAASRTSRPPACRRPGHEGPATTKMESEQRDPAGRGREARRRCCRRGSGGGQALIAQAMSILDPTKSRVSDRALADGASTPQGGSPRRSTPLSRRPRADISTGVIHDDRGIGGRRRRAARARLDDDAWSPATLAHSRS